MCEQSGSDPVFYIYDKETKTAEKANRHDAKNKAPIKNRKGTGFEILMFTPPENRLSCGSLGQE
jgi:hypothetical protein